MIIRPAQIEDAPEIANVQINASREAYGALLPQEHLDSLPYHFKKRVTVWKDIIRDSNSALFVAEGDIGIVGYAHIWPARDEIFKDYGELGSIYLLRKYH